MLQDLVDTAVAKYSNDKAFDGVIELMKKYYKKEKEQIEAAYENGYAKGLSRADSFAYFAEIYGDISKKIDSKTYRSYKELNGNILAIGDKVVFCKVPYGELSYEVKEDCLHITPGSLRDIFTESKFTPDSLTELGKICYGYTPLNHNGVLWPTTIEKDMEALTRLSLVLLMFAEGIKDIDLTMPDGKITRIRWNKLLVSEFIGYVNIKGEHSSYRFEVNKKGIRRYPFNKLTPIKDIKDIIKRCKKRDVGEYPRFLCGIRVHICYDHSAKLDGIMYKLSELGKIIDLWNTHF